MPDPLGLTARHAVEAPTAIEHPSIDQTHERSLAAIPVQSPYLGDTSYLLPEMPSLRPDHENTTVFSTRLREQILHLPGLVSLPSDLVFGAYADMYFEHLYHRFPIVQREDLLGDKRSLPLCQAICMVGSMLRVPRGPAPLAESEQYYTRAKTMTHLDVESDYIAIMKTMCLLMTWNIKGHLILTFDCAWQWQGMACRLLHQMGLHRNRTYSRIAKPEIARRLAWCIFVSTPNCVREIWLLTLAQTQDQLMSAAMGRPAAIRLHEFDVTPPTAEDFDILTRPTLLFIEITKLATILAQIHGLHAQREANIPKVCLSTPHPQYSLRDPLRASVYIRGSAASMSIGSLTERLRNCKSWNPSKNG